MAMTLSTGNGEVKPLARRLRSNGGYFLFDANVNHLLRVDKITYHLLPYVETTDYALRRFKKKFGREEVQRTLTDLRQFYDNGFLRGREHVNLPDRESFKATVGKNLKYYAVSLTEKCNLRCKYCLFSGKSSGIRSHSEKEMDVETAEKAVDFILKSSATGKNVGFYGGEPLLKFNLIKKIINYAESKQTGAQRLKFTLTTNGTLLTREVADYLVQKNVQLCISLDGPEEVHNRHRVFCDERGSFRSIIKNIYYVKEKYPDYFRTVDFIVVITPAYNYKKLENFFSQNNDLFDRNQLVLTDLKRTGNDFFNEPKQRFFTDTYIQDKLKAYSSRLKRRMEIPGFSPDIFQKAFIQGLFSSYAFNLKNLEKPQFPRLCKPGFSRLYIAADGKFYICENLPSSPVIGDIERGIDRDKCYELFKQYMDVTGNRCRDCWAFPFCSLCLKDFFDYKEDRFVQPTEAMDKCKYVKSVLKCNFESFLRILSKNPDVFDFFKTIEDEHLLEI